MPADGKHLLVGHFQTPLEEADDGFLAVAHRESGVVDVIAFVLLPNTGRQPTRLDGLFVNLRLADIMEQRRDDDAFDRKEFLYLRLHFNLLLPQRQRLAADIVGMQQQAAVDVEMEIGGGRRREEAQFFQSGNDRFYAVAPGRTEGIKENFFLFHGICFKRLFTLFRGCKWNSDARPGHRG